MITFRKMVKSDIDIYLKWIDKPHVKEWWVSEPNKIHEKFDDPIYIDLYILTLNELPFGYAQVWDVNFDELSKHPSGVLGIDLFIGEEDYLDKGLGTKAVKALSAELIGRPNVPYIIIDPQTKNFRAIKCYTKAGFVSVKTIQTKEGESLLMKFENKG